MSIIVIGGGPNIPGKPHRLMQLDDISGDSSVQSTPMYGIFSGNQAVHIVDDLNRAKALFTLIKGEE